MTDFPNGTVTLFFSDVEGSTLLLQRLGERYADVLDAHRRLLRAAVEKNDGREIDCYGDEFFAAFPRARAAVAAAAAAQRALAAYQWPDGETLSARIGLHTGEPALRDDGYLGLDVHRAARISAAAHGGQVLLSRATRDLLEGETEVMDLGEHALKDLPRPEHLFQLVIDGLPSSFPPPRTAGPAPAAGRERELGALLATSRSLAERIRPRREGLADLGWRVRALVASSPPESRDALTRLARELFDASRVSADADQALAVVDRKHLVQHLEESRELAVLSKIAARDADVTARRLEILDSLAERRRGLEAIAHEIRTRLRDIPARSDLELLIDRVGSAMRELEGALEAARGELDILAARLRRTRRKGVFRLGEKFLVPYFDEVGVERRRQFESLAEAVAFRRAMRIGGRAEPMFSAFDSVEQETTHLSGYVGQWEVGQHQAQRRR